MWRVRGVAYKELDVADIGPSTPLPGSEWPRPATHRCVGPADPDKLIGVTVVVRPRPGSPPLPDLAQWHDTPLRERRALSGDEYARVHRAAQADLCRPPDEYPVTVRRIDPAAVTA
jgi:hypothetical protein